VNYAPYAAFGGWSGAVNVAVDPIVNDAAYGFLSYLSQPAQATVDVTKGKTGLNPYRTSQFRNNQLWLATGMSPTAISNYLGAVEKSLNSPNMVLDLRIPQTYSYQEVLDTALSQFLTGEITRDEAEAIQRVYNGWEEITGAIGRESQLKIYRNSLNITQ
jgi:multiple sugar transport system substrate-binding protein